MGKKIDKNMNLHIKIAKGIKEPINVYTIPEYLRENAFIKEATPESRSYIIEAKKVTYIDGDGRLSRVKADYYGDCEIPFSGLNSNLEYMSIEGVLKGNNEEELNEIRIKIATVMDVKEINLLKLLRKKTIFSWIFRKKENRYFIFIKRGVPRELAKSMGFSEKIMLRTPIVNPCPVSMSDTTKGIKPNTLAYGVYGYESYIMALVEV